MAKYQDITIDQGTDVAIELELLNLDGTPKNLLSYSVASKIKKSYNSDSDNTFAFESIVSDASNGYITLSMTNQQTDLIKPGRYLYDVEISYIDSDSNTIIERILEGLVHITPSVTK